MVSVAQMRHKGPNGATYEGPQPLLDALLDAQQGLRAVLETWLVVDCRTWWLVDDMNRMAEDVEV